MAYWAGVDRRDTQTYLRAFTADATLSLFDGAMTVPVAQLVQDGGLDKGGFEHTSHTPASQTITIDRAEDGWRISLRRHSVLWQYDAERVAPRTSF